MRERLNVKKFVEQIHAIQIYELYYAKTVNKVIEHYSKWSPQNPEYLDVNRLEGEGIKDSYIYDYVNGL